jgi:hypothetical protein
VWTYKFKKAPVVREAEIQLRRTGPVTLPDDYRDETLAGTFAFATGRGQYHPQNVVVSVLKDGTVQITWDRVDSGIDDPPGTTKGGPAARYNVYAATVEAGTKLHHREVFKKVGEFVKLNKEPIKEATFADARKLAQTTGLFSHEIRAYYVTTAGQDAPDSHSATVLTLTSSVPRVTAAEQPDGSTLIKWEASPEKDIRGYAIYRMDEFRTTVAVRLNPAPVTGTQYVDWCESPRAERRRYYVVAVDALGQEGIPSTGAWSFGRP